MSQQIIKTELAPLPVGPYSQGIIASGELIFLAGQIPLDPSSGEVVGVGDIKQQTEQVINNIAAVLTQAQVSLDQVVKTTVFLTDLNNFNAMNDIYAQYFINAPARSTVQVSRLPKDVLVEIECIAVR